MTYLAAPDRYDAMPYRRCGRSGLQLPARVARPLAQLRPRPAARRPARDGPARVRPRHHALRPGEQLRPAGRLGRGELRPPARDRPRALSRRADHLDEGRLRHVARARTASGARASTCSPRSTRASRGWASTTSTSSTRTASTPTRRCAETLGALDSAVRQGKALYAGISSYSHERTREAAAILRELGTPRADPPAVLLAAEPLDRAGAARRARRGGDRLHRVLAARPGDADREVPRRRSGGLARRRRGAS